MKYLSAPWRWSFITKISHIKKCIFCQALKLPADESLVCYRGNHFFVILNKFPYSTGHLMIAPFDHVESPDMISPTHTVEMWELMNKSLHIIKEEFCPHGFNIGMNIGQAAGAGVKDHFHLHIVPRWQGDANFMPIVGNTKIVSYDLNKIYKMITEKFLP